MSWLENRNESCLRIAVPKRINFVYLLGQLLISSMFVFGTIVAVGKYLKSEPITFSGYLLHFGHLALWVLAGLFCLTIVLWTAFGKETIEIREDKIFLGDLLFGKGTQHEIVRSEVRKFQIQKAENEFFGGWIYLGMPGLDEGKIRFASRNQVFSFGAGLSDEQAIVLSAYLNAELLRLEETESA